MFDSDLGFKVVGIGASSAGLAMVRDLLAALPSNTGCAFFLVLDADAPSHAGIVGDLSADGRLDVVEAEDGMPIEPNRLYVAPPQSVLTLLGGKIGLIPGDKREGSSTALDTLLSSLAREYRNRAIAIVLPDSDLGSPDTMTAIEDAGGLAFVPGDPGSTHGAAAGGSDLTRELGGLQLAAMVEAIAGGTTGAFRGTNREHVTGLPHSASSDRLRPGMDGPSSSKPPAPTHRSHRTILAEDLEHVLNSIDVPTLLLDDELNIRFFTPATRSLFNIIPSDIGRPFWNLATVADDGDFRGDALKVLMDGGGVDREISARNGRWYVRQIKPYRAAGAGIEGVVITFIDMSVQKQLVEDREAAKRSAEIASEAKSHFLATASHDLRQPLQTLKLLQGLLEKSVTDEQSRIFVRRMEETLTSMSGILNSVLDINQIEAGMVQPKLENFSIGDLLGRLREEFSYQAGAKGLELRIVGSELAVHTDPRLLEQIVRNLLSNALKYTPAGKILVGCRRRGNQLRLEVWDTGIGIPEKQIEDVFKEYHQLDLSTRRREQGLGLGLSIVRRVSNLLGLNVSVRSQPGKGSVFSILIDRAPAGGTLVNLWSSSRPTDYNRNGGAGAVLIIEDADDMRDLLKMGLEQAGYAVASAGSMLEAVSIVERGEFKPEIVLADYNLSEGADGLAAIESVRSILNSKVPALILTGDISSKTLRKYAHHRVPHLNKPVKLRDVLSSIGDLLSRSREEKSAPRIAASRGEGATERHIEVIDDEAGVRDNIRDLFRGAGWSVGTYISAEEYLAAYVPERGSCLLVDAYLPGMSGLELLSMLKERGHRSPVIVVTGHSDVPMAVEAMKSGAIDFIAKPFSSDEIYHSVRRALELSRDTNERRETAQTKLAGLTRRQREILERIVRGQPNKIIAAEMKLSQRTVENHRASIMRRTESASLSALLRLVVAAEE